MLKEVINYRNLNCNVTLLSSFLEFQRCVLITRKHPYLKFYRSRFLVEHNIAKSRLEVKTIRIERDLSWICNGFCLLRVL